METNTDPAVASAVVEACEDAWHAIQHHHPEVPHAVHVLGSGVEGGRLVKLGHWWGGRWLADGQLRGEVLLAGEALHLPPEQVFEVLLHEAAHGLNAARRIKDTSRGGRYHNARYKDAAEEVGLQVNTLPPYGWAHTKLTPEATERYRDAIDHLGDAMHIARTISRSALNGSEREDVGSEAGHGEAGGEDANGERRRTTPPPASCGCGRKLRMAPSVLARGPVTCGLCGQDFTIAAEARHRLVPAAHPIVGSAEPSPLDRVPGARAARESGLAVLEEVARTPDGLMRLVQAGTWLERLRKGEPAPVMSEGPPLDRANDVVRAILKVRGDLTGRALQIGDREFLVGDTVTLEAHDGDLLDVQGYNLPPAGVLGTIESIDRRGRIDIDFPVAGRYTLSARTDAAQHLTYGYFDTAIRPEPAVGAPVIDLRQLDSIQIDDQQLGDFVELPR